jgi:hypothetical protein
MRELSHVQVRQTGPNEWQATGRDRNNGYLGTEFASTQGAAITKVFNRAKKAGITVVRQSVEIQTEPAARPAKVGPDRFTRH